MYTRPVLLVANQTGEPVCCSTPLRSVSRVCIIDKYIHLDIRKERREQDLKQIKCTSLSASYHLFLLTFLLHSAVWTIPRFPRIIQEKKCPDWSETTLGISGGWNQLSLMTVNVRAP